MVEALTLDVIVNYISKNSNAVSVSTGLNNVEKQITKEKKTQLDYELKLFKESQKRADQITKSELKAEETKRKIKIKIFNEDRKRDIEAIKAIKDQEKAQERLAASRKFDFLSQVFGGMALQRIFGGFFKTTLKGYTDVSDKNDVFVKKTNKLGASFNFLLFSLGRGFAENKFVHAIIDQITNALDGLGQFFQEHQGLAATITTLFGALSLLGGAIFLKGTITSILMGFTSSIPESASAALAGATGLPKWLNIAGTAISISLTAVAVTMAIDDILVNTENLNKATATDKIWQGIGSGLIGTGIALSGVTGGWSLLLSLAGAAILATNMAFRLTERGKLTLLKSINLFWATFFDLFTPTKWIEKFAPGAFDIPIIGDILKGFDALSIGDIFRDDAEALDNAITQLDIEEKMKQNISDPVTNEFNKVVDSQKTVADLFRPEGNLCQSIQSSPISNDVKVSISDPTVKELDRIKTAAIAAKKELSGLNVFRYTGQVENKSYSPYGG